MARAGRAAHLGRRAHRHGGLYRVVRRDTPPLRDAPPRAAREPVAVPAGRLTYSAPRPFRLGVRLFDYPASCNCYKVRLLLAQLELPYERGPIDIFDGDTLTAAYAAINPARTTPVLETDDGRFLPESNAILFYLAQETPFLPDDPFEA